MNIELKFLQKAIEDKNYVCFSFDGKSYKRIKALKLELINSEYILNTDLGKFDFNKLKKIKILKDRY
jgi:hypothetical protein